MGSVPDKLVERLLADPGRSRRLVARWGVPPPETLGDPRWSSALLHLNSALPWRSLLTRDDVEVDLPRLSKLRWEGWSAELIEAHAEGWDWAALSANPSLPWSAPLIARLEARWDWGALSLNPSLPWSPKLLVQFREAWVFPRLAANPGIRWTRKLVAEHMKRLQAPEPGWSPWMEHERPEALRPGVTLRPDGLQHLQQNPSVDWRGVLRLLNDPDWSLLSRNPGFGWDKALLKQHRQEVDWLQLSRNTGVDWRPELLQVHRDRLAWRELSANPSLPWTEALARRHSERVAWRLLSRSPRMVWSEGLLEDFGEALRWDDQGLSRGALDPGLLRRYAERLDWNWGLSTNRLLPWTAALVAEHAERWNWERLGFNPALPWNTELLERCAERWKPQAFERNEVAGRLLAAALVEPARLARLLP